MTTRSERKVIKYVHKFYVIETKGNGEDKEVEGTPVDPTGKQVVRVAIPD